MRCPYCRHPDSRVVDSREAEEGQLIRRRRSCPECGKRFTTVEEAVLAVVKRSGVSEPFSRPKVIAGVRRACQGRPVSDDALAVLAHRVEEAIRATGSAEVPSHDVGLAILGPLRELDEVAYMRFASVYRSFSSLEDFEAEIAALRDARPVPGPTATPPADGGTPASNTAGNSTSGGAAGARVSARGSAAEGAGGPPGGDPQGKLPPEDLPPPAGVAVPAHTGV
ncbi:MAG: transcriptional regulator NrdR [Actinomycetia bacterium]|nr:transcriptional regulator NrdR [Actinomycetes bacterium]